MEKEIRNDAQSGLARSRSQMVMEMTVQKSVVPPKDRSTSLRSSRYPSDELGMQAHRQCVR